MLSPISKQAALVDELQKSDGNKDKRQADRDTVIIGANANRQYYNSGPIAQQQQQLAEPEPTNYVTPRNSKTQQQQQQFRAPLQQQQQLNELPPEYLRLLQEISLQQQPFYQRQGPPQQPQPKPKRVQAQQEFQFVSAQPSLRQEPNVKYVTEEEYVKLLENQKAYHLKLQQQQAREPEGLEAYRSQKHPSLRQQQQAGRPLSDFDKELAQLVESNKPLQYAQAQAQAQAQGYPPQLSQAIAQAQAQAQAQAHQQALKQHHLSLQRQQPQLLVAAQAQEPNYVQPQQQQQKVKNVIAANIQFTQKGQVAHKPQSVVESPAQKYQFLASPQLSQGQEDHQRGEAVPQVQYYFPREKDVLAAQQAAQAEEAQRLPLVYDTQAVMKVVEPPQLQQYQQEEQKQVASHQKYVKKSQKQQKQGDEEGQTRGPARQGAVYVSRTTQGPPLPKNDRPELPPLKIRNDRPLTQAEFQALVDQGYNVVPVPVPVPYAVQYVRQPEEAEKTESDAQQSQTNVRPRHHAPAYRYGTQQTAASQPQRTVTYLQPVSQDDIYAGVRGPNSAPQ